jgi:hypothetical protein
MTGTRRRRFWHDDCLVSGDIDRRAAMDSHIPFIAPPTAPTPPLPDGFRGPRGFGDDGPSFFDMLDIINPFQHIPVVSSIYRAVTGDEISHVPRLLGGALFGGLFGAIAALVNVIVDEITGSDVGEHVLTFVDDLFNGGENPTVAQRVSSEPAKVVLAKRLTRFWNGVRCRHSVSPISWNSKGFDGGRMTSDDRVAACFTDGRMRCDHR